VVDYIAGMTDQYATRAIHQNASSLAENEAKASVLSYLESIFDETNGQGLSAALADFWSAWQDLADNPAGIPERTALLSKAEALIAHFHAMNADLNQTRDTMNSNLRAALEETNQITGQIAALNERIVASESGGTVNNDLRDQRNNYLEELSSLMGVRYLENQDGSLFSWVKLVRLANTRPILPIKGETMDNAASDSAE
jgi:flagellar hook-associated protein 1 FlgK